MDTGSGAGTLQSFATFCFVVGLILMFVVPIAGGALIVVGLLLSFGSATVAPVEEAMLQEAEGGLSCMGLLLLGLACAIVVGVGGIGVIGALLGTGGL